MSRSREYPLTKAPGAISIVKLRNAMAKEGLEIVEGKNIRVNGELRGCSGFCRLSGNNTDGRLAYFTTESTVLCPGDGAQIMYRAAKSAKDYSGGCNHWCRNDAAVLCSHLAAFLADDSLGGWYGEADCGGWARREFIYWK